MKVAVINFSGNTGKTTLAKHMLAPLLGAHRIQIEDVNAGDGRPDQELAASKFKDLAGELNVAADDDHFVLDIGASNAKAMIEHFSRLKSTRAEIDWWVIPVVPGSKQIADSLNTARCLVDIGVQEQRIVMILNKIEDTDSMEHDFDPILAARKSGVKVAGEAVLDSEVFEMLKGRQEDVFAIAGSRPDFEALKGQARTGDNPKEALRKVGVRMVVQDMAESAAANLKSVFEATPMAAALAGAAALA